MRTTPLTKAVLVVALIAIALVPRMPINRFWVFFIALTMIQAMLVASLNLAIGYTGLVSLGHNALFAIGAYATAYFTVRQGFPVWAGILLGLAFGALAGLALAVPAHRAHALYFGIISLAFLFLTFETVSKWQAMGANRGFPSVPNMSWRGEPFTRDQYYWVAFSVFVLALFVLQQISNSALGRSFVAVRENEPAAASLGVGVFGAKARSLAISAALAGLAGALSAHLQGGIFPRTANFESGLVLFTAAMVGGIGTFAGPLVGVAVIATIQQLTVNVNVLAQHQPLIYGLMLIGSLAMMRYGIVGTVLMSRRLRNLFLRLPALGADAMEAAARPVAELVARRDPPIDGPILRLAGIVKRFDGVRALDGIDLTVEAGTIHGVIGPNGSGKSTLVNVVTGFLPRDAGTIAYAGKAVHHPRPHVMAHAGLVRIFQHAETFGRLTVIQNVLMGLHMRADRNLIRCMLPLPGRRRRERELGAEAFAILSALGIAERAFLPVSTLPYGERRLLEIARAIGARPRLLVLDEPATGLTQIELVRLALVLRALRDAGVTILIIEHNIEFLMGLVDRVTVLDYGRLLTEGAPAAVQRDPGVIEAYLGEPVAV